MSDSATTANRAGKRKLSPSRSESPPSSKNPAVASGSTSTASIIAIKAYTMTKEAQPNDLIFDVEFKAIYTYFAELKKGQPGNVIRWLLKHYSTECIARDEKYGLLYIRLPDDWKFRRGGATHTIKDAQTAGRSKGSGVGVKICPFGYDLVEGTTCPTPDTAWYDPRHGHSHVDKCHSRDLDKATWLKGIYKSSTTPSHPENPRKRSQTDRTDLIKAAVRAGRKEDPDFPKAKWIDRNNSDGPKQEIFCRRVAISRKGQRRISVPICAKANVDPDAEDFGKCPDSNRGPDKSGKPKAVKGDSIFIDLTHLQGHYDACHTGMWLRYKEAPGLLAGGTSPRASGSPSPANSRNSSRQPDSRDRRATHESPTPTRSPTPVTTNLAGRTVGKAPAPAQVPARRSLMTPPTGKPTGSRKLDGSPAGRRTS